MQPDERYSIDQLSRPAPGYRAKSRAPLIATLVVAGVALLGAGVFIGLLTRGDDSPAAAAATGTAASGSAPTKAAANCVYGSFGDGSCLPSPSARAAGTVQDMYLAAARGHSGGKVDDDTLLTYGATVCATLDVLKGDVAKVITDGPIPRGEQLLVVRDAAEYLCPQWRDETRAYSP